LSDTAYLAYPNWWVIVQGLVLLGLVLVCATRLGDRFAHRIGRGIAILSRRRWRAVAVPGLVSLTLAMTASLATVMPYPRVHDEFSYLLAADTFAHGRLTNPTSAQWQHFETMHVIQQPSYASKYPPGQGLELAAGQVLTGKPIVGAWVTAALACAATSWMLLAWFPPRWALVGAVLLAINPQTVTWSQSYWGGELAMLAGSLMLGAALRIMKRGPRYAWGVVLAVSIAILANTRPSEGLLFTLMLLGWLGYRMLRGKLGDRRQALARLGVPLLAVLVPTAAFMGYYNYRVTGNVLNMPYMVHDATYAVAPPYVWLKPRPIPPYRHRSIQKLEVGWELPYYQRQQTASGLAREVMRKTAGVAGRYLDPSALAVPLRCIPLIWRRDRRLRIAIVFGGVFFFVLAFNQTWLRAHYVSPATALGLTAVLVGLRYLRIWQRHGRQTGRIIVRSIYAVCIVTLALWALVRWQTARRPWDWAYQRSQIIQRLQRQGGKHLIVVRYLPSHDEMMEWVANGADLNSTPVIWAHEMSPSQAQQLIASYPDRQVWLLAPDQYGFALMPYTPAAPATPADSTSPAKRGSPVTDSTQPDDAASRPAPNATEP